MDKLFQHFDILITKFYKVLSYLFFLAFIATLINAIVKLVKSIFGTRKTNQKK